MLSTRYSYVILNTAISLIAFARNLVFMRTLQIEDLAQVSLMQTLVMLIGFVQFGLLNGAYVTMAEKDARKDRQVTNLIWTGLGFLALVIGAGVAVGLAGLRPAVVAPQTLVLAGFAGTTTLASTFLNNALIARGALKQANTIGIVAVSVSFVLGLLSYPYGLFFALLALLSQPLLIALGALIRIPDLRPSAPVIERAATQDLFRIGAPVFMGTFFLLLSYQVERWMIVYSLGETQLGQFYIVMMYMNFFVLLPASILNLHFPPALRALQAGSLVEFQRHARRHLRDLLAFFLVAGTLTFLLLPWLLQIGFPQFRNETGLIFLAFPAMIFFVLRDTAALTFLATRRTRSFIISAGVFFTVYAAELAILEAIGAFSLQRLIIARGVASVVALLAALYLRRAALVDAMGRKEVV
ncbi:lipopolysaccharide biosynthesis protein [Martelella soudanensis]|uniref:lipopolysaccharide biosynthesis protein n=1 Tax=unclassified Martelella TaxID=2629616 RepID=UPI0015DE6224|nr:MULTISPECIES: hypothetical protein [unclassified Martelella]